VLLAAVALVPLATVALVPATVAEVLATLDVYAFILNLFWDSD